MPGPQPITPINFSLPIVQDGGLPTVQFAKAINDAITALQSQVSQLSVINQQTATTQQQVIQAQQSASAAQEQVVTPPPASTRNGSQTATGITVTNAWTAGPTVALAGVAAGDLNNIVATIAFGTSGGIVDGQQTFDGFATLVDAAAEIRIVELPSGDVVFPPSGTATFSANGYFPTTGPGAGGFQYVILAGYQTALSAFSAARATTGAISYRLDMRTTAPTTAQLTQITAYLYVNRT